MNIEQIFQSLQKGKISPSKAKKLLSLYSIEKIGSIAQIDTGRKNRKGIPEIILGERKQLLDLKKIIKKTLSKNNEVLVSRIKKKDYSKILEFSKKNKYKIKKGKNTTALLIYKNNIKKTGGKVGIIAAGTSDVGVGEEARLVCESMNCDCLCSYDVGIAGLHRIFPVLKQFVESEVSAIIVVAGMEGALASIVSSIADVPVIGVPTSIGYGYGEKGVAALASMLQSCSLGLTVVNIDNGVGAGAAAANIANRIKTKSTR
ncbi:nickel pincer cofactor biosynthesis protein LarB [Marine Group I thaumarchaeote]|uniref:Nickel pincer cofactor biosynthesis protein LarB n=1 Tax=Marine Group I thaumarchaeote TaxID=2511932 RepID=A0A7K4MPL3_9ARCH|nr:nickel pincer cofactor biosynthesis protein LarB [Marine Group I thaumarchaeote]